MQERGQNHNLLNVALAMETLRKTSQCKRRGGKAQGGTEEEEGRGEMEGKKARETIRSVLSW